MSPLFGVSPLHGNIPRLQPSDSPDQAVGVEDGMWRSRALAEEAVEVLLFHVPRDRLAPSLRPCRRHDLYPSPRDPHALLFRHPGQNFAEIHPLACPGRLLVRSMT